MDLEKIYREEDLFPREIADCAQRDYGLLFYSEQNKASYDSNHALLFQAKTGDLGRALDDITAFYLEKGIKPIIYQSIADSGYFESRRAEFAACGYEVFSEENRYMLLLDRSVIQGSSQFEVYKAEKWDEAFRTDIFEAAGEPWETEVAKKFIQNANALVFAARFEGRPVGILYAHLRDGVCRVDYLLVAPKYRGKGAARAIASAFADHCRQNRIEDCFLWPDGESAERVYYDAGFRLAEVRLAARASFNR